MTDRSSLAEPAETGLVTPRSSPGDSTWFAHDRFGLFIHWGLFSMGARDDWYQRSEAIPADEYATRYFARFDPDLYDPDAWADAAASSGMRYVVVVAKHTEGFCLWDSALTDFKAPNTPAGRDLLRPLLDAFRNRGLRTGLYYSLPDWHHPDFTVDYLHPLANSGDWSTLNAGRDWLRYREYAKGQIRELLTEYGQIDIFWPDFSYDLPSLKMLATNPDTFPPGGDDDAASSVMSSGKGPSDWDSEGLLAMIRGLRPSVLVNDRLGLREGWDIRTPEQTVPPAWPVVDGERVLWEACQTLNGRWGYSREVADWKSVEQLVVMLIDIVSKGGNLLLNVGPTARGEFEHRALDRLAGIGTWMRSHNRSIYGCTQAPGDLLPLIPAETRATYNPSTNRLYLHLLHWPAQAIIVPGLRDRVEYAQLLHDGSELIPPTAVWTPLHAPESSALWLELPRVKPDVVVPVIELFLRS